MEEHQQNESPEEITRRIRRLKRQLWIGLGILVAISIAVGVYFLYPTPAVAPVDETPAATDANPRQQVIDTCQELVDYETQLNADYILAECELYLNAACASDDDCGPFPCDDGVCRIQACASDQDCSAGRCGDDASATPGFCTITNVP